MDELDMQGMGREDIAHLTDINELDEVFMDGGEVRCERVMDRADNQIVRYYQFSEELDSPFMKAHGEVIDLINERLRGLKYEI